MSTQPLHKQKVKLKSSSLLEIDCPSCGVPVHPQHININKSLGKCDSCDNIFSFDRDEFFLDDRPGRPEMIMPEGTDVLPLSDSLDIRINWFKSHSKSGFGFLTFFTLMWNGMIGFMASQALASGAAIALAGMSLHIIAGMVMLYWLLSVLINKTDIIVKQDEIRISQSPLKNPFKKDRVIKASDLKQLYVTKYVKSTTNGEPNYAYALYAIRNNGRKVKVIDGMNKETQLYLEQEIERFLRLPDESVRGSIAS